MNCLYNKHVINKNFIEYKDEKSKYNDLKNKVYKRLIINNILTKEEEYLIEKYNEFILLKDSKLSNENYSWDFIELFKKDYDKSHKIYEKLLINLKDKETYSYFNGKYQDYIYCTEYNYTQWEFIMIFKEDFEILKSSEYNKSIRYEELIIEFENIKNNFIKIRENEKYIKIHKDDKYLLKDTTPYDNNNMDIDRDEYNDNILNYNYYIHLKNDVIKRILYDDRLEITELEKYLMEKYNDFSTVIDLNSFLNLFKNDYNSHSIFENINYNILDKYLKELWEDYFEYSENHYKKWEFIMIFQYILDD
jgi:hypothetical protein